VRLIPVYIHRLVAVKSKTRAPRILELESLGKGFQALFHAPAHGEALMDGAGELFAQLLGGLAVKGRGRTLIDHPPGETDQVRVVLRRGHAVVMGLRCGRETGSASCREKSPPPWSLAVLRLPLRGP
jgi:hypothetical protein